MSANTYANIRAIAVVIITVFIVIRALQLYFLARSPRLLILTLTMTMIALTTTADTIGENVPFHLNSYWFNYFGQTTSYIFFFLSLLSGSEKYLRKLVRWQFVLSALLLTLLFLGPVFPTSFPQLGPIRAVLSSGRALPCAFISLYYASAYMTKANRFSGLMSIGFLILSVAYYIIFPRYILPHQDALQIGGDFLRMIGFGTVLIALIRG
jgi:hypothetical protein